MPVRNRREQELDPKIRDQVNYIIGEFEAHDIPMSAAGRQQLRAARALAERLDQIDIVIACGCLGNVVETSTLLAQAAQTSSLSFQ